MKETIEIIEGVTFKIYTYPNHEKDLLIEAKTKASPLTGTYSFDKHKPHNSTGEYHIHVYDGNNEIFSINQTRTGHDGYSGTRIPNKVFQALKTKFPKWHLPSNQIIESYEYTTLFDFRGTFLRSVNVMTYYSDPLNKVDAFPGFFHQFASDPILSGNGYIGKTVAIIENMNGNIFKIPIDKFRFTDMK